MAEQQDVIFKLGGEEYGINIMNVTEIIPYEETIKLPHVPNFVEGVINYRGTVIPIICLKKKFGMNLAKADHNTRIIILNLDNKQVGFIVDEASQTIKLNDEDIDMTQSISTNIDIKYVSGIARIGERLIILVDLDLILTEDEKTEIESL